MSLVKKRGSMFPMWLGSARNVLVKAGAILVASFSLALAQQDSVAQAPVNADSNSAAKVVDSAAVAPVADSVKAAEVEQDSSLILLSRMQAKPVTPPKAEVKRPYRSVLYLGGGEHSAWFHLGVLYAIESYAIPVDSVVGVSWGAFIGFLWTKGVSLDDIQRIMLDPYIAGLVGHNEMDDLDAKTERTFELPVSLDGMPTLRHRFTLSSDTAGNLYRNVKTLEPDMPHVKRSLSRLRLQESLYRQPAGFMIPFLVERGNGASGKTVEDVYKGLPLQENAENGELDPYLALPHEQREWELSLVSVADPKNGAVSNSPWQSVISRDALKKLDGVSGVVIRAHSIQDSTRSAWIQAGFSAVERRLSEMMVLRPRMADYTQRKRKSLPWFKFKPAYDSLSAEVQASVGAYWNESDTGMVAPERFAKSLMAQPTYDSVSFKMQATGDVQVTAVVKPTFDVYAGGFGSNAIGPNLYAGVTIGYVDQMEFNLDLPFFWGNESYGFMPRLHISRLWNARWSLHFGYDLMKLRPLESFGNDTPAASRIYSEQRNDLTMSVDYKIDALQHVSLGFLFGDRTFELDRRLYKEYEFETYPVSPSLNYELLSGENDRWFARNGFAVNGSVGMQSIGFQFGLSNVIPIYWKLSGEARYTYSPTDFFTVNAAVAAGLDAYHDEGNGYVYPESFDYRVLDNCFRQHVKATPWSTEWYNPDLASHHYGLIRMNVGLHRGWVGAWIFGAYVRDYEDNPSARLGENKFALEPALRFAYKSISAYVGMTRLVDNRSLDELKELDDYKFFVRIGNYDLF